jgi:hypothetical protein
MRCQVASVPPCPCLLILDGDDLAIVGSLVTETSILAALNVTSSAELRVKACPSPYVKGTIGQVCEINGDLFIGTQVGGKRQFIWLKKDGMEGHGVPDVGDGPRLMLGQIEVVWPVAAAADRK